MYLFSFNGGLHVETNRFQHDRQLYVIMPKASKNDYRSKLTNIMFYVNRL